MVVCIHYEVSFILLFRIKRNGIYFGSIARVLCMRSLASVYKLMYDFSGPTIGNYKGFTWQSSLGKLPSPHQNRGTASALQALREVAGKGSEPLTWCGLLIFSFLAQASSSPRLHVGPWVEVPLL